MLVLVDSVTHTTLADSRRGATRHTKSVQGSFRAFFKLYSQMIW